MTREFPVASLDALSGPDGTQAIPPPGVFPDAVGGLAPASMSTGAGHRRVVVPPVVAPPPRPEFAEAGPSWGIGSSHSTSRTAAGRGARHIAAPPVVPDGGGLLARAQRLTPGRAADQGVGWLVVAAVALGVIAMIFLLLFAG
ncbi:MULTISPECIES: hypothetical protein [Actinoalloteichus]|uniref:Uncharacterized protein n=1 Tax=Actinoalloteichus fjordicus TaxID=1612552 RepID=A0AAC9PPS8_9PSEU|nr:MULTISPECIES: hypothetical protein [Actinoalloteichus]APU12379.1 hypothetical protein UA74_01450 [Actinoalloteichus fjordicus]APU18331.1 hypothetical protein UA75_01450 [Actinoalloteichus sp. GBA129-24]